jgi:L-threonylcarbamoyladenylate synthase
LEQVELFCEEIPDEFYLLAKKFLPGSLSVVLRKKKSVSDLLTAGLDTVAIRFPGNEMAIDLIESFGRPLAATSANISGGKSPSNAVQVYEELQDKIPLIIDGGETEEGKDSTVISLASKPAVLRHGVVPVSEIEEVLGCQFRL